MANIYVCLKTNQKRRTFTKALLSYAQAEAGKEAQTKEKIKEPSNSILKKVIDQMEIGKTKSPYYMLHKKFYGGKVHVDYNDKTFMTAEVYISGFRSLYFQNSYYFRPGYWIVIQLRNTNIGRSIRNWITKTIPESQIGLNPPESRNSINRWLIRKAKDYIRVYKSSYNHDSVYLSQSLSYLNEAYKKDRSLFNGKDQYIWETLAFLFADNNLLTKADYCLRTLSTLQPGKADAFLNLGYIYKQKGQLPKALTAYEEGLTIDPEDQYVKHNLKELLKVNNICNTKLLTFEEIMKAEDELENGLSAGIIDGYSDDPFIQGLRKDGYTDEQIEDFIRNFY